MFDCSLQLEGFGLSKCPMKPRGMRKFKLWRGRKKSRKTGKYVLRKVFSWGVRYYADDWNVSDIHQARIFNTKSEIPKSLKRNGWKVHKYDT